MAKSSRDLSPPAKIIIAVLLLMFLFPVGVVLTWVWIPWSTRTKILIIFGVLVLLGFTVVGYCTNLPVDALSQCG